MLRKQGREGADGEGGKKVIIGNDVMRKEGREKSDRGGGKHF